jgi:hypothetical protein
MKKEFNNFIKTAKREKLSDTERSVLRSKILEFISYNPIRGKMPILRERSYISIFEVRYFAKAASLVLIIAVVAGGSGVSLAASSALPGDKLYSVKVNVNEGIESTLAMSPEASAAVNSKKVERRLVEAQTLDKENKLSPELQMVVEKKLEEHIDNLAEDIENLREEGNLELALETTSNLTPVLEAHKEILEDTEGENKKDHENTGMLIARVEDSIREVEDSENSIIASVEDDEVDMSATTMMMTASDPIETEFVKQAEDDIAEINNDLEKIVKSRIRTAKDKIENIVESRELELSSIVAVPVVVAPAEIIETPMTISVEAPQSKVVDTKETPKIVEPIQTIEETATAVVPQSEFDIDAKIDEAKKLLREADDKLDRGRFKEALSLAQDVNRIASEIETYKKLKALDLAQKTIEVQNSDQTAEASASVK